MVLSICIFLSALAAFIAAVRYYKNIIAGKDAAIEAVQAAEAAAVTDLHSAEAFIGKAAKEYQKMKAGATHELDKLLGAGK